MDASKKCALFLIFPLLSACGSDPVAYRGLRSASAVQKIEDGSSRCSYRYGKNKLAGYSAIIIEPVKIYDGNDGEFGSNSTRGPVSQDSKTNVAEYMGKYFTEKLSKDYSIVNTPGNGVARLNLTLTGIERSIPVVATTTFLNPFGLAAKGGAEALGSGGGLVGAIFYAAEVSDSLSNTLLYACINKQTPDALDPLATIGYLDAAKTGVRIGARDLDTELSANGLAKKATATPNPGVAPGS